MENDDAARFRWMLRDLSPRLLDIYRQAIDEQMDAADKAEDAALNEKLRDSLAEVTFRAPIDHIKTHWKL